MLMKVGQIYKTDGEIVVVSFYRKGQIGIIYNDGYVINIFNDIISNAELIAEYPTWQEAVNSKEFRDENI